MFWFSYEKFRTFMVILLQAHSFSNLLKMKLISIPFTMTLRRPYFRCRLEGSLTGTWWTLWQLCAPETLGPLMCLSHKTIPKFSPWSMSRYSVQQQICVSTMLMFIAKKSKQTGVSCNDKCHIIISSVIYMYIYDIIRDRQKSNY